MENEMFVEEVVEMEEELNETEEVIETGCEDIVPEEATTEGSVDEKMDSKEFGVGLAVVGLVAGSAYGLYRGIKWGVKKARTMREDYKAGKQLRKEREDKAANAENSETRKQEPKKKSLLGWFKAKKNENLDEETEKDSEAVEIVLDETTTLDTDDITKEDLNEMTKD